MAMIKNYFFFGVLFLCALNLQAQFTDDMESYTDGEPINQGHWTDADCGGGEGCSILTTSNRSRSGDLSGLIENDETTKAVLDLGNKIFGEWGLSFWVFIPEGKEAVMSLQGTVPFEEGNSIVGDFTFNKDLLNPGVGVVSDSALGEVSFDFPHNEWFRIVMNVDISLGINAATWQFYVYDMGILSPGTPFTNENGEYPEKLGGILFSSTSSNNELYVDDFNYTDTSGGNPFPDLYPFEDDMEYETGEPLEDWWVCPPPAEYCMEISLNQAHSGTRSGLIPNDTSTDVILNLGNRVQSEWALEFYMYVPTGKEAYWNLQGVLPVGAGEWIVGNIYFNKDNLTPGIGVIDDSALGIINFNYPQDEWFRVAMNFNLTGGMSIATWGVSIDNTLVIPEGTPFTNNNGDFATSLGGVDFYSISSNNEFYLDDFNYINGILELEQLLGIDSNSKTKFILFPNPSIDIIHIQTDEVIRNISIYNVVGYKVLTTSEVNTIDVTLLSNGVYFVVVETDKGKSTQKLIKE